MEKLFALMRLFEAGQAVADPALWKSRQVTATAVGGVVIAGVGVARAYGIELPIDETAATAIAGGILAVVNLVLTVVTSKKIGLK
ncbi:hypothetical protein [Undibacterium squillarum]|uniref:Holin n=1 Tax=Undibacterium squillarum TaxID=1131567 RepID=A0ABQ2Y105_9BURK|nr:hypothetical protein [Undibacterium squillarum]GGX43078.1 hypothetical protein GCM10010946_21930 [Undibacterium squillarum]